MARAHLLQLSPIGLSCLSGACEPLWIIGLHRTQLLFHRLLVRCNILHERIAQEQRRGGIDALDCEQRAPVVNGQPDGMDAVLEPLVRVEEPAHALHPLTEEGEGPREGERAAEREREREKEEGWPGCRSGDER